VVPCYSQVRYAACVAVRNFMRCVGEEGERFLPTLTGPMCLNRSAAQNPGLHKRQGPGPLLQLSSCDTKTAAATASEAWL
jgi:hypothetical protein